MHPYRTAPLPPAERPAPARRGDDLAVAAVLTAVGLLRVAIALAGGERFGVEATIAALMMVLGVIGLVPAREGRSDDAGTR